MCEKKLKDKVAVIAGGASGIGKKIAQKYAEHGAKVAILDIQDAQELARALKKEWGVQAGFYHCDISDCSKVERVCQNILKDFGSVDILLSAAGYGPRIAIQDMEISQWQKTVDINLSGTFYLIRYLIEDMINQGKGNIILIGSGTIISGSGGGIHYAATKTALYGLIKGLSYELLPKGIRANIITPHIIDTPLLRKRYPDSPEVNEKLAQRVPLGRIGTTEDIANIALFLASDESGYICGADILADGGALRYT